MEMEYISAEQAVQLVENGNRVFIHGSAATPVKLINALLKRAGTINNVDLVAISISFAASIAHSLPMPDSP